MGNAATVPAHKQRSCPSLTGGVSRLLAARVFCGAKSKVGRTLHPMPPTWWKATPLPFVLLVLSLYLGQVCITRSSGTNSFSFLMSWRFFLAGCQELLVSTHSWRWDPRSLIPSGVLNFLPLGHWPQVAFWMKPDLPCWPGRNSSFLPHLESTHGAMARMKIPEAFLGCSRPTHHLAGHLRATITMETWGRKMFPLNPSSSSWLQHFLPWSYSLRGWAMGIIIFTCGLLLGSFLSSFFVLMKVEMRYTDYTDKSSF